MSDEEFDYMSDAFLVGSEQKDIRPGLIQNRSVKRNLEMSKKRDDANKFNKDRFKPRKLIEQENFQDGLQKPLSSDNKGFALLQKMGFKPGTGLGKKGEGRSEPIPVDVKTNREGLGVKAHIAEIRAAREKKWGEAKEATPSIADYRARISEEANERQAGIDLYTSQRICQSLDTGENVSSPLEDWFLPQSEKDIDERDIFTWMNAPTQGIEEKMGTIALVESLDEDNESMQKSTKMRGLPPKLCGSRRKRYQWLVRNGYSREEALEKCTDPIGSHPSKTIRIKGEKRPRENVSNTEEKSPSILKKSKLSTSQQTEGSGKGKASQTAPPAISYQDATEGVRVGIIPVNYPEIKFSKEQSNVLEDEIIRWVLETDIEGFGPQFLDISHREGWTMLICANKETADWIIETAPKLKPWENAKIKGITEDNFPNRNTLVASLCKAQEMSQEQIMKALQIQNPLLRVSEWFFIRRTEGPTSTQVFLSIDDDSAARLTGDCARLYFRFTKTQFHVVGARPEGVGGGTVG